MIATSIYYARKHYIIVLFHTAIESVQEGLESLSVYVAGNDVVDTISQRSDHHPSTSEVVSLQCVELVTFRNLGLCR